MNLKSLDKAAEVLRELARENGWDSVEIDVRPDGRVTMRRWGAHGTGSHAFADLNEKGLYPRPSVAVEAWRKTR